MNEEYIEEDVLEDPASNEDVLSSDQADKIIEKLETVEALLNEDIAIRSVSDESVSDNAATRTVSGNDTPDYSQYIYDLLTDSSVKVSVVAESDTIADKPLNQYSVGEALSVVLIVLVLIIIADHFIHDYVFKFHRR